MKKAFVIFTCLLLGAGCVKRELGPLIPEEPEHHEEVITSVILSFTDSATAKAENYWFADNDGPGGIPSSYGPGTGSVITLAAGSVYFVDVVLLNASVSPPDTISNEVREEGDEHMLFFDTGTPLQMSGTGPDKVDFPGGITIRYNDADNSSPARGIGLQTTWTCPPAAMSERLRLTLKHQPEGKTGSVTDGETDLEVFFSVEVR